MDFNINETILFIAIQIICFLFFMIIFWTYCIATNSKLKESFNILVFIIGVAASVVAAKFFTP